MPVTALGKLANACLWQPGVRDGTQVITEHLNINSNHLFCECGRTGPAQNTELCQQEVAEENMLGQHAGEES